MALSLNQLRIELEDLRAAGPVTLDQLMDLVRKGAATGEDIAAAFAELGIELAGEQAAGRIGRDVSTIDMLPPLKKRGRPSTGKAKTAAERKQDQRVRDSGAYWSRSGIANISPSLYGSLLMAQSVANSPAQHPCVYLPMQCRLLVGG